ncbi:MAG: ABC transporter permease [Pseudomonadota bacterium]
MIPAIGTWGLVFLVALIGATAIIVAVDHKLPRQLIIAFARMALQLLILAAILGWLLDRSDPITTGLALVAIALLGGLETAYRVDSLYELPVILRSVAILLAAGAVVALPSVLIVVSPEPWHDVRLVVPIFGMAVGSSIAGTALAVTTLHRMLQDGRTAIEAQLALGRRFTDATRHIARQAITAGMLPVVTATAATGMVTIPGMMSGQIIAGAAPAEAIRYQFLIMTLIAAVTAVSIRANIALELRRWTDHRARFRARRRPQ